MAISPSPTHQLPEILHITRSLNQSILNQHPPQILPHRFLFRRIVHHIPHLVHPQEVPVDSMLKRDKIPALETVRDDEARMEFRSKIAVSIVAVPEMGDVGGFGSGRGRRRGSRAHGGRQGSC